MSQSTGGPFVMPWQETALQRSDLCGEREKKGAVYVSTAVIKLTRIKCDGIK